MSLRVLHVIPSLVGGGAERQLVALSGALTAAGVDVHLAYLHGGPNLEPARQSGATLHPLVVGNNHDPRVIWSLRQLIRRTKPVAVQTWLLHADVFGGLAARWCRVPWLLAERSSQAMYGQGQKFRLRRWLGRSADLIVANSQGGQDYWRAAGFAGPSVVIRNIVAKPHRTDPGSTDVAPLAAPHIVAVGRLSEEKNFALLLDALALLFKHCPDARASILGDGPQREALAAQIARSSLLVDRVALPGHVDDVAQRLSSATLCVSLSRFEGTPNTVIEAVNQGCPLVLSDIPAHREWLSGDEARWVSLNNPEPIAAAMQDMLRAPTAAREKLTLARARLQAWSADRIAAQYISAYEQLINREALCASS